MHTSENEWTDSERDLLRNLYPNAPVKQLRAAFPNRTDAGLQHAATKLGLSRHRYAGIPKSLIGHLSEAEKGYIGGLIDGEGCIHLSKRKVVQTSPRATNKSFSITVSVANTDPNMIKWLWDHVGPHVGHAAYSHHKTTTWRRPCFFWALRSRAAEIFLQEIQPYLVIKPNQAELLKHGFRHMPDAEREALYEHLRSLKRPVYAVDYHIR